MKKRFTTCCFLFIFYYCSAQEQFTHNIYFKSEAQSLDQTLIQLSKVSQINISFDHTLVSGFKAAPINQSSTFREILEELLAPTKLKYKILEDQQIVIQGKKESNSKYYLSGRISDSITGEFLIGAIVYDQLSGKHIETNDYGFYSIHTTNEIVQLECYYLGYAKWKQRIILKNQNTTRNIFLSPAISLPEVVVTQKTPHANNLNEHPDINLTDLKNNPKVLGQQDIVRGLMLEPGITSGADGFGGLNCRGGSYDQNLFLLDDVPVYYPSHGLGLMSIFNADAIRNIRFFKSNIPAAYNGRLSSIIDVHTKDGNLNQWSSDISIGLLNGNALIEGPIIKNKLSILVAGRRTVLDPFIKETTKFFKDKEGKEGYSNYYFYDLNAKINLKISNKQRFYLSYYQGKDLFTDEELLFDIQDQEATTYKKFYHLSWRNELLSARYNVQLAKNLFSNVVVYSSKFQSTSEQYNSYVSQVSNIRNDSALLGRSFYSNILEKGLLWRLDYSLSTHHRIIMGIKLSDQIFKPTIYSYNQKNFLNTDLIQFIPEPNDSIGTVNRKKNQEYNFYIEDQYTFRNILELTAGFRSAVFTYDHINQGSIFPRIAIQSKAWNNVVIGGAWDQQIQSLHLLNSNSIGLPTDLWVPSTQQFKPQHMESFTLFMNLNVLKHQWRFETYDKALKGLIHIKEGASFDLGSLNTWQDQVVLGKGHSKGFEASVEGKMESLKYRLNYTRSHSTRHFAEINNGQTFDYLFDRPHQLNISLYWNVLPHLVISSLFEYSSGSPISLPIGKYEYLSRDLDATKTIVFVNDEINGLRLPNYMRLDLGLNYTIRNTKNIQEISFGIYNILNRRNPVFIELASDPKNPTQDIFNQVSLMPFLPSLSYRIKWN